MHVGINAVPVGPAGAFSYLEALVAQLPAMYPEVRYTFFVKPAAVARLRPCGDNVDVVPRPFAARSLTARLAWEQLALPVEVHRRHIDVLYHMAAYDLPLVRCPRITRIDNMAPFEPQAIALERSFRGRWRLRLLRVASRLSSYTSACTLVPMDFVADELVERHGLSRSKTLGINRGVTSPQPPPGEVFTESAPPEFILVVATLSRYKLLERTIDGYAKLRSSRSQLPPLLIAGHAPDAGYRVELDALVQQLGLQDRVRLLGHISRSQLLAYMRAATVTLFPSIVETCALTLIEEMLVGSALIVADRSVMPRLCGDSVVYFDPSSPDSLAAALGRLLDDDPLRAEIRRRAAERAAALDLDWDRALRQRQTLFAAIAAGQPPSRATLGQ